MRISIYEIHYRNRLENIRKNESYSSSIIPLQNYKRKTQRVYMNFKERTGKKTEESRKSTFTYLLVNTND